MTCPNCKCPECREASKAEMKAVLARVGVSRETFSQPDDAELRRAFALQPNALQLNRDRDAWRDTEMELQRGVG